jgi:large subunit ribosomal protein L9
MSTQVILTADVEKVGAAGQTVTVADGFARNFLFPRNLALPGTPANLKRFEAQRKKREAVAAVALTSAQELAAKLAKQSFTINADVGEGDKLHGSITAADIAKALQAEGLAVDRKQIMLEHPLHTAGVFDVDVKLHPSVSTKVKVWIVAGETTPATAEPKASRKK